MKNVFFTILIITILVSCHSRTEKKSYTTMKINTNWQFSQVGKDNWLTATVPGTVHTDLFDNGAIENPFYRLNEKDQQWIDKTDWEYKTEFELTNDLMAKNHLEMVFNGLDTYADVFLNEQAILSANNMFRTWTVDCKQFLKTGKNKLLVVLKSPITIGLEKLEKSGYQLPADNDQSENGELGNKKVSVFTRKAGYHFGWDWGPRLVTSGIWRDIELVAWDDAKIKNVQILQKEISSKIANLSGVLEIFSDNDQTVSLTIQNNKVFLTSKELSLKKGSHFYSIDFEISQPNLWWPNGLGEQNLYPLEFSMTSEGLISDKQTLNFGLRNIQLVQKPDTDGNGQSFYFEVNGRPVFAKGANYIPNDVFLPRVSPEDYEFIVKSAADANMNMLRVWGGGIYENDIFYDLCDKYGILVWQDFMFACAMYPGDDAFLKNVRQEAIDNVKRLRNHPCLALWCGNNEIEEGWNNWGWIEEFAYDKKDSGRIFRNFKKIFHELIPWALMRFDTLRPYITTSPKHGWGHDISLKEGDSHYWGVWWGDEPFSVYEEKVGRFMSEFGFQGFPIMRPSSVFRYLTSERNSRCSSDGM